MSAACCESSAIKPCELMPTFSVSVYVLPSPGLAVEFDKWRKPRRFATDDGDGQRQPSVPARITELASRQPRSRRAGASCAGRGHNPAFRSGGRVSPCQ